MWSGHSLSAYTPGPGCSKRRWLNELVKGHFVNCFSRFNTQYSDIFCWKNVSSFCTAKATHIFFSKKFQHICVSLDVNFNESLTIDVISFEQLGPGRGFRIALPINMQQFRSVISSVQSNQSLCWVFWIVHIPVNTLIGLCRCQKEFFFFILQHNLSSTGTATNMNMRDLNWLSVPLSLGFPCSWSLCQRSPLSGMCYKKCIWSIDSTNPYKHTIKRVSDYSL